MDIYWFYGWIACSASFALGWTCHAMISNATTGDKDGGPGAKAG